MKWLNNLPTRTKLLIAFGVLVMFFVAGVLVALRTMLQLEKLQRDLVEHEFTTVVAVADLRQRLDRQRLIVFELVEAGNSADRARLIRLVAEGTAALDQSVRNVEGLMRNDPESFGPIAELKAALAEYRQGRTAQLELIQAGRMEEARAHSTGEQERRFERMIRAQEAVYAVAKRVAASVADEASALVQSNQTILATGSLLTIGLGLGLAALIGHSISSPLRLMAQTAEKLAEGDLTIDVAALDQERRDEVGVLASAMVKLTSNLRDQIRQVSESVAVLSASARQISASTTQLAANAAETAAAVSETSATVEELRQTAVVASQKARMVSDTSQRGAEVAVGGRRSVEETLGGMQRIQAQMDSIAERMVRLSEQSQSIGQIVTTVEDLAAQSNMLAVNAGIEAAKAGEHGRGFVVVAQEMRSLAEQSKQATVQVMAILNEIQKAAGAATLATEQGGRAVEAGATQATQTGQSIQALAANVTESASAAAQIAASSQQQLVGVGQVATSMEGVKQATLQNADGAKQLDAAARNLNELGDRLQGYVRRYRL